MYTAWNDLISFLEGCRTFDRTQGIYLYQLSDMEDGIIDVCHTNHVDLCKWI